MQIATNRSRGNILRRMSPRSRRLVRGRLVIASGFAILLGVAPGSSSGVTSARVVSWSTAVGQQSGDKDNADKSAAGGVQRTEASPISPAKQAQIRRLLELTGAKRNAADFGHLLGDYLKNMVEKSLPHGDRSQQIRSQEIEDALVNTLMMHLNSDELMDRLVPIYDKTFTEEELKGIIGFYETPTGRKLLEATPKVMEEANDVSEQWARELIPKIMEQMLKRFPELQQGGK